MITKNELDNYAKITNLNLGQAEKDYFQTILLFILYQEYGNEFIFKGGTALKKCFLHRKSRGFSCDSQGANGKISASLTIPK